MPFLGFPKSDADVFVNIAVSSGRLGSENILAHPLSKLTSSVFTSGIEVSLVASKELFPKNLVPGV